MDRGTVTTPPPTPPPKPERTPTPTPETVGGSRRTVVLVGPRAAGKTTLAAALGGDLG